MIIAPPQPVKTADHTTLAETQPAFNGGAKNSTEIVFQGRVVGNNGKGGLLRMHWMAKTKLLNQYQWAVSAGAGFKKHRGPVKLELTRHSSGVEMDYDNLVSTGKLLIDAIVKAGVLPDDNQAVIAERSYRQVKAKKDAQRTVIRITDL